MKVRWILLGVLASYLFLFSIFAYVLRLLGGPKHFPP
jgi:hypothetical protein